MRILILGGTGEARELAAALVAAGTDVISSLAGRVREPRLPDGPVRVGGFGGADGLAAFLREEGITQVIDATHPFAGGHHGERGASRRWTRACRSLVLRRPGWASRPVLGTWSPTSRPRPPPSARWPGEAVFLTTGRRDLGAFAADAATGSSSGRSTRRTGPCRRG